MNIAEVLKKNGLSKVQFASDFFLSRPTLDEYIIKFENGDKLPKAKYQIIFDSLFSEDLSDLRFRNEYASFKRLISRDKAIKIDDLNPNATDKIFRIINDLKRAALEDEGLKLINFISFVSRGYNNGNELANAWVLYFNELNSLQESNDITEKQKKYLGCFYVLNRDFNDGATNLDISNYAKFMERKKELKLTEDQRRQEIQERVSEIIKQRVEEEMKKMSADVSDDEIVQKIVGDIQ